MFSVFKKGAYYFLVSKSKGYAYKSHREVDSKSEEMPYLEDCTDVKIAYPVEEEALVIRCVLNMQIKEDDVDRQWENIFHTRCHI